MQWLGNCKNSVPQDYSFDDINKIGNVLSHVEFPAEVSSWLIIKCLNQVHSLANLLDAKYVDLASQADSDDEAAILPPDQDTQV